MNEAIRIVGLEKRYRGRRGRAVLALDGLDLSVPTGSVYGFLGPNGSGKTTTIRCLLGLARPNAGTIEVLGNRIPSGAAIVAARTGSVVEGAPSLTTMTAREQLGLLGSLHRLPKQRVDDVLERVGLGERAGDVVKRYSLGMRQRLALAGALLKDPELLVLDEPANGLDPAGMRDLRLLLRELADEGRTVFVSSHLLGEIEHMCDGVAIVHRGRVVASGDVAGVIGAGRAPAVLVTISDVASARQVLAAAGYAVGDVDGRLRIECARAEEVAETLGRAGLWVRGLEEEETSLETLFLELTADAA